MQALVAEQVQGVLGSAVGGDDPLMAAGLDSLGATELQQSLADILGMELPSTLVFDYPTVNAMAEFLAGKLALSQQAPGGADAGAGAASGAIALASTPLAPSVHAGAAGGAAGWAVAIVGAAGQQALLQQHRAGDASGRVPYTRWDADSPLITGDGTLPAQVRTAICACWCSEVDEGVAAPAPLLPMPQGMQYTSGRPWHFPSSTCRAFFSQFGAFLPDVELFDSELFGVMRTEALTMDPQQRLLLHASYEALAAGSAGAGGAGPAAVFGRAVGAFVGIAGTPRTLHLHRQCMQL